MPESQEVIASRNSPGRTVETLREEMLALFAAQNRRIDESAKGLQSAQEAAQLAAKEAVNAALAAQKEGTASALAASDRAVSKAEVATEKRFEGVNEFRQQLGDQARTFMPRTEAEVLVQARFDQLMAMIGALGDKVNAIEIRITTIEGKGQGQGIMIGYAALIIGLVSGLLAIAHFFIKP